MVTQRGAVRGCLQEGDGGYKPLASNGLHVGLAQFNIQTDGQLNNCWVAHIPHNEGNPDSNPASNRGADCGCRLRRRFLEGWLLCSHRITNGGRAMCASR